MSDFQPGHVVKLKSGGPKMVVMEVGDFSPIGPNPGAKCEWIDDKQKRQEDVFAVSSLEKYTAPTFGAVGVRRG